jgi:hypothetical protein
MQVPSERLDINYTGSVWTRCYCNLYGSYNKDWFTGVTDYVPVAELTEVYNGSFTSAAGWIEIH